ncbi:DUF5110 domain-containing protein [Microbulbifer agarilyticus]|uniref:glycoside hydrolase family 31 protein n=1 Tax=Microbulbifer agarilyticus TaxID=260552 RepID=UPI001C97083C|nr:TIM-barrel domain-containing protein [Microbulbifer agarilyticus]MBY6192032.1 DUF5110 domain-containing protein [Microbulbifer agarilyticus]
MTNYIVRAGRILLLLWVAIFIEACDVAKEPRAQIDLNATHLGSGVTRESSSIIVTAADGRRLRVTPYGNAMVRMQSTLPGEEVFPDDHYAMVARHDWPGEFGIERRGDTLILSTAEVTVHIDTVTLAASFLHAGELVPVLRERLPVRWHEEDIHVSFEVDSQEHFTGLGHGYFGRADSVDLRGEVIQRNYGSRQIEQAPLIVPFYLSSKGYGVFLNSTFPNRFSFAAGDDYSMAIETHGFDARMDYFFIGGRQLASVLDHYTQLTGRPRLPQKAMFGLQLSDKGHDHNSATPSDETWWKRKITEHRVAGYPLDHVVNDNRWRAAGGKRCESKLEWDPERYPDPAAYGQWLTEHGLVMTLDFNRCIGQFTAGWDDTFNLPTPGEIDFKDSAPDLTNDKFRAWFWWSFLNNALKPADGYPGDALWIDEFDEQGAAPKDMILANGRSSAEMRNYWFFLIAQSLVAEGWDKAGLNKRPYVWVRGMTAGAQRYATLWSGDIYPDNQDMAHTVRAMQLAGLSGFPYWGHDAGGFYDWEAAHGPDEDLYQRWGMALGAFSPIWKPHGMGQSRWPLDRSDTSQAVAKQFTAQRYELMPYLYSTAHKAAQTGLPMARAMLLDYQHEALAWQYDLQYMWGDSILVAPQIEAGKAYSVWLPPGSWYTFDQERTLWQGGREIIVNPESGELPLFVKAGGIIPQREFALSTAFIDKQALELMVFAGADGSFELVEDDDVTEAYRISGEKMTTRIQYLHNRQELTIAAAEGAYTGAPLSRDLSLRLMGIEAAARVLVDGEPVPFQYENGKVTVRLDDVPVGEGLTVRVES